jgi:hypothetical protein
VRNIIIPQGKPGVNRIRGKALPDPEKRVACTGFAVRAAFGERPFFRLG